MKVSEQYRLREMRPQDGTAVWRLVRETGVLDVNSAYSYMLLGDLFASTCAVAEEAGSIVGFVSGLLPPERPDTLFVWQIGVARSHRGQGLAKALIEELLARRRCESVRYVETTISPGNQASQSLFLSLARHWNTRCDKVPGYRADWFPAESGHEEEVKYRIGPIHRNSKPSLTFAFKEVNQ